MIKLFLANEGVLFRELLVYKLSKFADIQVCRDSGNFTSALDLLDSDSVDIVLTDISNPISDFFQSISVLQNRNPRVKVVLLSSFFDRKIVKRAIDVNVWGILSMNCSFSELMKDLSLIYSGKKIVCAEVQNILIEDYLDRGNYNAVQLTKRENEILRFLAEGKTIKQISETQFISVKTVATHKINIFEKMHFESMAQLIRYALSNGIVS